MDISVLQFYFKLLLQVSVYTTCGYGRYCYKIFLGFCLESQTTEDIASLSSMTNTTQG